MEKIGVIGLGRMGSAIALRMQAMGHQVSGWTRSGRTVDGISAATDVASLVAQSDTLILSLYDDAAVAEMLDVLLVCDLNGKQIIETSTVVPDILKDRSVKITAKGGSAVDAPISGGPEMVADGTCGVFIGGDESAAKRAMETLRALSGRIFHVGPLGAGLVMKTINNGMMQVYMTGLGEMLPLAKRAGLSLETMMPILCGGPAGLPMVTARLPKVFGDDTEVGFTISAVNKDNDVFQRVVQSFGLPCPLLDITGQRQRDAIATGLGDSDPARMINWAYDAD